MKAKFRINKICRYCMQGFLILYSLLAITVALLAGITSWEFDSLNLPIVSLQYRSSITTTPDDLIKAKNDLPEIYGNIDSTYIPNTPLIKGSTDEHLPYYFPIYPLVCLPAKLVLQFLGYPQVRAFTLTNAVLVIFALFFVYKFLKVSEGEKLLIILLLSLSPVIMYIPATTAAECMIFSFVTIALVLWHENHYNTAAVFVVLAGWENPTVMMLGAVMIINFLADIISRDREYPLKEIICRNWKKVLGLAVCYVWCFIPFIVNYIYIGKLNDTFGMAASGGLWGRFCAYIFDLNLGFMSFAFFLVLFAVVALPLCIFKRDVRGIYYYAALIATVAAYSVAWHINCGMIFCARYVMWSYPMLVAICVRNINVLLGSKKFIGSFVKAFLPLSCLLFMCLQISGGVNHSFYHNVFARKVLNSFPELYNPLPSTFYCRTRHIDGAYGETGVCIYSDSRDKTVLRKILLPGTEYDKNSLLNMVKISGNSEKFIQMVNSVPNDGEFHYININKFSDFSAALKNEEEMGHIEEKQELVNLENVNIPFSFLDGNVQVYAQDVSIKPDTYYKVTFAFDGETSWIPDDIDMLYADIYAAGYDRDDQQINITNIADGDNTVYIKTDDIPYGINDICVRMIAISEIPLSLNKFSVIEMQYTDILSEYIRGNDELYILEYSADIQPFTDYSITVNLSDADLDSEDVLFMDLYGGMGYDSPEQEKPLIPGTVNKIIINSGDTSTADSPIHIRIVGKTKEPIQLSHPIIQKAEQAYG